MLVRSNANGPRGPSAVRRPSGPAECSVLCARAADVRRSRPARPDRRCDVGKIVHRCGRESFLKSFRIGNRIATRTSGFPSARAPPRAAPLRWSRDCVHEPHERGFTLSQARRGFTGNALLICPHASQQPPQVTPTPAPATAAFPPACSPSRQGARDGARVLMRGSSHAAASAP